MIFEDNDLLQSKIQTIKSFNRAKIDCWILNQIRSGFITYLHKRGRSNLQTAKVSDFRKFMKSYCPNIDETGQESIIREIRSSDDDYISMDKLTTLIDFYNYYPVTIHTDKNESSQLFQALSNGTQKASSGKMEVDEMNPETKKIYEVMELVWSKVEERFSKIRQAFWFFDINNNTKISQAEFSIGLWSLRVQLTPEDEGVCFSYLDQDRDGYLDYTEFCRLM